MRLLPAPVAALLACACVGAGASADTAAPRVVATDPPHGATGVSPGASLAVRFSEPLREDSALSSHGVVLLEGVATSDLLADLQNPPVSPDSLLECERSLVGATEVVLRPRAALRSHAVHSVVATRNVRDRAGNRLGDAPVVVTFTTRTAPVRLVVPEGLAPPNLVELVVAREQPFETAPQPDELRLEDGAGTPVAAVPAPMYPDARLRGLRLLGPLRPAESYRVRVGAGADEAVLFFGVASEPDEQAPRVLRIDLRPFDGALEVAAVIDEPSWLRVLSGDEATLLRPGPWSDFGRTPHLLLPDLGQDRRLWVRFEARDAAGLSTLAPAPPEPPMEVWIHPLLRVEINEVVTDPQRDWSDGICQCTPPVACGVPFDAQPGCDSRLGAADEWIELANRSGRTLDLTAGPEPWRLRVVDETPESTVLAAGRSPLVFSPGSQLRAWRDGDLLVVKTAGGSNNDARIELVDPWGSTVDILELGRETVPSGRSSGVEDEAVARVPGTARWCRMRATPGALNTGRCTHE